MVSRLAREKGKALATKGKREKLLPQNLPQKGKGNSSCHRREMGKALATRLATKGKREHPHYENMPRI